MELVARINKWVVRIRMSWVENFLKINKQGGTFIRDQRVLYLQCFRTPQETSLPVIYYFLSAISGHFSVFPSPHIKKGAKALANGRSFAAAWPELQRTNTV